MRPPQPQVITKVSISALVISLPILYVSLLRLPPSTLARDTTFWFLMSNSIILIIAADSGMLFFSPTSPSSSDGDDGSLLSNDVVPGDRPAVAVHCNATSMPLMASDKPTTVDTFDVVRGEQLRTDGVACCDCETTNTNIEGHALALIREEEEEAAASKPSADDMDHALVLQRREESEAAIEPSTNNNYGMVVECDQKQQQEGEVASASIKLLVEEQMLIIPPSAASEDVADELVIIDDDDYAFADKEPWRPVLVTSKSVVEEGEEDRRPISHPRVSPGDVPQEKSNVDAKEGKRRCSAAEGSRTPEEREYWQLSDEELNRKVEEFITRFNRDMRLQVEQEAGVCVLAS